MKISESELFNKLMEEKESHTEMAAKAANDRIPEPEDYYNQGFHEGVVNFINELLKMCF